MMNLEAIKVRCSELIREAKKLIAIVEQQNGDEAEHVLNVLELHIQALRAHISPERG